jgi:hypothetical protein
MSSLSQEEIDALINQLSGEGAPAKEAIDGRRVKSFDFRFNKRLDKFSNNQLQTLRTLHENFTRLLNNSLSVYLRTRVEATIVAIEQISYGDFIASIGIPSILAIFSMDPLPGSGDRPGRSQPRLLDHRPAARRPRLVSATSCATSPTSSARSCSASWRACSTAIASRGTTC